MEPGDEATCIQQYPMAKCPDVLISGVDLYLVYIILDKLSVHTTGVSAFEGVILEEFHISIETQHRLWIHV